ncbi:MAG: serine hydrolase [Actinomycetota bacterium]|nr:serine hydrolase [Actinomycetota bacterium]
MRTRPSSRALPVLLAVLALLLGAAAPARAQQEGPVGGPLLGSRGVVLPVGAPPVPAEVVAHGWLVADLDTGAVLAAKDAHGRYAPASTLKILTAVALIPELDPRRKLVPTYDDIAVDGSKVGLVERVGYPVDELFAALMMVSGNDVANTLARGAGGPAAIATMNKTAQRLGALDTHAVNPSGLDARGQVSSPYDLAVLSRAGMQIPAFRRYVATRSASVSGPGGRRIETANHNRLLRNYPGALGIKNGWTSTAKASFVGAARRNGRTLVVSLMRTRPGVHREAATLLDWGFAAAAAGVQPVGTLVEPLPEQTPTAAPPPVPSTAPPTPAAGPADRPQGAVLRSASGEVDDGGLGMALELTTAAGVLALAVVLRRRRVVRRRRQRRLAAR